MTASCGSMAFFRCARTHSSIAALSVLLWSAPVQAIGLTPDPTFNGIGATAFRNQANTPIWHFSRVGSDSKIVLVGSVCPYNGDCAYGRKPQVARLLASGAIETTSRWDRGGGIQHLGRSVP